MSEVYFFGCWNASGHFLRDQAKQLVRDAKRLRIPSDIVLDGGPMFLPPEKVGTGALTYLPACDITLLAWWGNPFDTRPGTNNAILIRGAYGRDSMWHEFSQAFPTLAPKLERPIVLAVPDWGYGKAPAGSDISLGEAKP